MGAENKLGAAEAQAKDEIQEIMNEIESLKESMTEAPKVQAPPSLKLHAVPPITDPVPEAAAPAPVSELELETQAEPQAEPEPEPQTEEFEGLTEPEVTAEEERAETERRHSFVQNQNTTTEEGCLTMTLSGKMTLKLQYEFADQAVTVGFEDEMLRVELSDGTEFKIPVKERSRYRKVA